MIEKKLKEMGIDIKITKGLKTLLKRKEEFTEEEREEITKLIYKYYHERNN